MPSLQLPLSFSLLLLWIKFCLHLLKCQVFHFPQAVILLTGLWHILFFVYVCVSSLKWQKEKNEKQKSNLLSSIILLIEIGSSVNSVTLTHAPGGCLRPLLSATEQLQRSNWGLRVCPRAPQLEMLMEGSVSHFPWHPAATVGIHWNWLQCWAEQAYRNIGVNLTLTLLLSFLLYLTHFRTRIKVTVQYLMNRDHVTILHQAW